jgi:hypothetical protein
MGMMGMIGNDGNDGKDGGQARSIVATNWLADVLRAGTARGPGRGRLSPRERRK